MPSNGHRKEDLATMDAESGMQWVKAGPDSKREALLVMPRMLKRICFASALLIVVVVLVFGWSVKRVGEIEERTTDSKLRHAIRETAQRVGMIERIKERIGDRGEALENVSAKQLGKILELDSELREAHKEQTRSQTQMMARLDEQGVEGTSTNEARGITQQVPEAMQRKMLDEFAAKAMFVLQFTEDRWAKAWRTNAKFNTSLPAPLVQRADEIADGYTDGNVDTKTTIKLLAGNITDGDFPPPISLLDGVEEYSDALTDDEYGIMWTAVREEQDALEASSSDHTQARSFLTGLLRVASGQTKSTTGEAFTQVYSALKQAGLLKWLFVADDPDLDDGFGAEFYPYRHIAQDGKKAPAEKSTSEADDDDDEK